MKVTRVLEIEHDALVNVLLRSYVKASMAQGTDQLLYPGANESSQGLSRMEAITVLRTM